MKSYINYTLLLFIILSILPFLLLCFYIHPYYDDYSAINELAGRNILEATIYYYHLWTGRFSTSFVFNILAPGVNHLYIYRLYPILLMALWISSFVFLFRSIIEKNLLSTKQIIYISFFFFILYLYKIPEVTTGFYFMVSAYVTSTGTIAMVYLLSVFWIILKETNSTKKIIHTLIGCLLAIFIGGSYESVMVMALFFLSLTGIVLLYKRDTNFKYLFAIIACMLVSAIIMVIAPGNKMRGGAHLLVIQKAHLIGSIVHSITFGGNLVINTIQNPLLILATILFIPVAYRLCEGVRSKEQGTSHDPSLIPYPLSLLDIHPVLSFSSIFIVACVSFFPGIWAQGDLPPRAVNQIYLFTYLGWFLAIQTLVIYFCKKEIFLNIPPQLIWLVKGMIILCLIPSLTNKTIGRAYSDVFSKARPYNEQLIKRDALISQLKAEGKKDITIPPLFDNCKSYPLSIYYNYFELGEKPTSAANEIYAKYLGVDSIRLENTICIDFLNETRVN